MTASIDQFTDITRRSQEAWTTATRLWVDYVQSLTDSVAGGNIAAPDAASPASVQRYVDGFFDIADKMLSDQREFARQWINASVRAGTAVTEQAARATKSVSAHSANGAEAVINNSAEAVRATGEQAASSARAARQAAKN
jgi:hypothetical protein